jgi:hypothetical protein
MRWSQPLPGACFASRLGECSALTKQRFEKYDVMLTSHVNTSFGLSTPIPWSCSTGGTTNEIKMKSSNQTLERTADRLEIQVYG